MQLKHTPGPWLREGRTVYTLSDKGVNHFYLRVEADPRTCSAEEAEATAMVITAAPDMVQALLDVEADHMALYGDEDVPVLMVVRAALKKAGVRK